MRKGRRRIERARLGEWKKESGSEREKEREINEQRGFDIDFKLKLERKNESQIDSKVSSQ